MPRSAFGPFDAVFETGELKVPGYLPLLGCGEESRVVFDRIDRAIHQSDDPAPWVQSMLADLNWRPHLVAAIVLLVADLRAPAGEWLWDAIDRGSWVTPQLVVVAFLGDYSFRENAIDRLDRLCPVRMPAGTWTPERHSAMGPAGTEARRAKEAASLLAIAALVPDLQTRVAEYQATPDIQELLKVDEAWDESAEIALLWLGNVKQRLAERRRVVANDES